MEWFLLIFNNNCKYIIVTHVLKKLLNYIFTLNGLIVDIVHVSEIMF